MRQETDEQSCATPIEAAEAEAAVQVADTAEGLGRGDALAGETGLAPSIVLAFVAEAQSLHAGLAHYYAAELAFLAVGGAGALHRTAPVAAAMARETLRLAVGILAVALAVAEHDELAGP